MARARHQNVNIPDQRSHGDAAPLGRRITRRRYNAMPQTQAQSVAALATITAICARIFNPSWNRSSKPRTETYVIMLRESQKISDQTRMLKNRQLQRDTSRRTDLIGLRRKEFI